MFIKVHTEDRSGVRRSVTIKADKIRRVREQGAQAIITQDGEEYDVWTLETKSQVDELIRNSGAEIAEIY
ncbi:hypothetical protein P67b_00046 [Ruegeria phage Tedan]|nr:hypothetical protein P67b_00046 [Ruegeria phage Tedan]